MKKFEQLGRNLGKEEMRKILGGVRDGGGEDCGKANTYCGSVSKVTCCEGLTCESAGIGQNPNIPGGDKFCA